MTKKTQHKRPHVLGIVKGKHIAAVKAHPKIVPLAITEESPQHDFNPEDEHILAAHPKKLWDEFMEWLEKKW
jgi:hypothetical protein